MSIPERLEKLKLLVDEMQLARHLALHAPDAFSARTLARHIVIRAENFIAVARSARKPLNRVGYNTKAFHQAKETYAEFFDEYFHVARDKLGAHVQDFDFGKRIELWNEIEVGKIGFFVDGALEIYKSLGALGLPGYIPYSEPPEIGDATLNSALHQFQRSKDDRRGWVEFASDSLALTRENTTAALNFSPVHARAAQVALIRRWINTEVPLLNCLSAFPRLTRILKARVLTDIVSFCDCLVTRQVAPGAPQELEGLDKLVADAGQSAAPISEYVAASNFAAALACLRLVRDKIGAHIDNTAPLAEILQTLDEIDLENAYRFFDLTEAAFEKQCRNVLFLAMYMTDGHRAYGITAGRTSTVPFSGEAVTLDPVLPMLPLNDDNAYPRYLTYWLHGSEAQKGDARQFFWNAFSGSEVVELIEEIETNANVTRRSTHEYRRAHRYLEQTLSSPVTDEDFCGILDLTTSCANGWPYPLTEALVRSGTRASEYRQWLTCYALGELPSWPHQSAEKYLRARCTHPAWGMRLQAIRSLFKNFIKKEGQFRINHRDSIDRSYPEFLNSLVIPLRSEERLICALSFASHLSGRSLCSFANPFAADYARLQSEVVTRCTPYFAGADKASKLDTLNKLVQSHDYVGAALLLAIELESDVRNKLLREGLLQSSCDGSIETAAHDQGARHLALCFYVKKEYTRSLEVARSLAARNPESIVWQVLVAQILAEKPGSEDEALTQIARIREAYKVDTQFETALLDLENDLTKRRNRSES
jgi:hypothetical protein